MSILQAGDDDKYEKARVLISGSATQSIRTKQPGQCGDESDFIHISKKYIESYKQIPAPFDNDGEYNLSNQSMSYVYVIGNYMYIVP